MPIAEKLKPLTDTILAALIAARKPEAASDQTTPAFDESGSMSTKALMAKVGESDLTKMRAALKALVSNGQVYKLGNTRSTVFKAVLLTDDGEQGEALRADPDAPVVIAGQVFPAVETAPELEAKVKDIQDRVHTAKAIKSLQDEAHAASDASDTGRVPRMTSDSVHVLKGTETGEFELSPELLALAAKSQVITGVDRAVSKAAA